MKFNDYYHTVLGEIEETLRDIDQTNITYFLKQIMDAQRIFIAGVGRTGMVMRCCLLYTSPSPRDVEESRMPSSA